MNVVRWLALGAGGVVVVCGAAIAGLVWLLHEPKWQGRVIADRWS